MLSTTPTWTLKRPSEVLFAAPCLWCVVLAVRRVTPGGAGDSVSISLTGVAKDASLAGAVLCVWVWAWVWVWALACMSVFSSSSITPLNMDSSRTSHPEGAIEATRQKGENPHPSPRLSRGEEEAKLPPPILSPPIAPFSTLCGLVTIITLS